MQKVVYECDNCLEVIGNKKHVSVSFGKYSGIALPPVLVNADQTYSHLIGKWTVEGKLEGNFLHFCNGKCIGGYFTKLLKETKHNDTYTGTN